MLTCLIISPFNFKKRYLCPKTLMTKLVSIVISFLVLIQSFQFAISELIEIDELMEHADFHANEYGDNFMVFLSKHYGKLKSAHIKSNNQEQKEHEKLPFQHASHTPLLSVFVMADIVFYAATSLTVQEYKSSNYYYQDSHSTLKKEVLFLPPKQA